MENMAKSYIHEIPEGYEARIEGNKVIIELAESEDERIINAIIGILKNSNAIDINVSQEKMFAWLEKQKEQIPYTDFVIKPHKGDDNNPYDMQVSEAQEYAIKRGFGIPFNDGEVYVDERHLTQTIGNILRWADEHPKEQKPNYCHHEVDETGWSDEYRKAYYDGWNNCNIQHELLNSQNKPAEWKEEDEKMLKHIIDDLREFRDCETDKELVSDYEDEIVWLKNRLKSLRPQPKQQWSEEDNIGWDEAFACVTRAEKAAKSEEELQNAVTAEKWLKEIKFKYYVHPVKQEWSEETLRRFYEHKKEKQ